MIYQFKPGVLVGEIRGAPLFFNYIWGLEGLNSGNICQLRRWNASRDHTWYAHCPHGRQSCRKGKIRNNPHLSSPRLFFPIYGFLIFRQTQRPISSAQTIEVDLTTRLNNVMRRCNNQEASKMVNDMMTGLFSKEHMASHTLTGTMSREGTDPHAVAKHQLDRSAVQEIVGETSVIASHTYSFVIPTSVIL